jgi:hypothetical protein
VKLEKISKIISVTTLLLFVFVSPHIAVFQFAGVLPILFVLLALFLITALFITGPVLFPDFTFLWPAFLLTILFLLFDIILRQKLIGIGAWFVCLLVLYLVARTPIDSLKLFIKWLMRVNYFFILLSLILFGVLMTNPILLELFIAASKENIMPDLGIIRLFGGVDAEIKFGSLTMPRITAYVQQSSLLPAYIMLPFSLGLMLGQIKGKQLLFVLFFLLLSFGGNVYFALIVAVILMVIPFIKHTFISISLPFILFILISTISLLLNQGASIEDASAVIDTSNSESGQYVLQRASSGSSRLFLLSSQAQSAMDNIFIGTTSAEKLNLYFGAILFTYVLRLGIIGLILGALFYAYVLISHNNFYKKISNYYEYFGYTLFYSLLLQAMCYNDYGFSSHVGLIFFSIALRIFKHKTSPAIEVVKG